MCNVGGPWDHLLDFWAPVICTGFFSPWLISTAYHSSRSGLMLTSYQCLGLHSGFPTETIHAFLLSPFCVTCTMQLLHQVIVITSGKQHSNYTICNTVQHFVIPQYQMILSVLNVPLLRFYCKCGTSRLTFLLLNGKIIYIGLSKIFRTDAVR
jgi:hypothetical protein